MDKVLYNLRPTMSLVTDVVNLLDIPAVNKNRKKSLPSLNRMFLVDLINKGLPYSSLDHVLSAVHWPKTNVANWLDMSEKTIRRYEKEKRVFSRNVSSRIVGFAKVVVTGKEIFEDNALFNEWMQSSCIAFGGKKPVDLLCNSEGVQMILDELERIEWGVYS